MNTYFAFAVTAFAIVSSASAQFSRTPCTTEEITTSYKNLGPLAIDSSLKNCSAKTGFSLMGLEALPTHEQTMSMCKVKECGAFINKVDLANPSDCVLQIPGSKVSINIRDMTSDFATTCSSLPTVHAYEG